MYGSPFLFLTTLSCVNRSSATFSPISSPSRMPSARAVEREERKAVISACCSAMRLAETVCCSGLSRSQRLDAGSFRFDYTEQSKSIMVSFVNARMEIVAFRALVTCLEFSLIPSCFATMAAARRKYPTAVTHCALSSHVQDILSDTSHVIQQ